MTYALIALSPVVLWLIVVIYDQITQKRYYFNGCDVSLKRVRWWSRKHEGKRYVVMLSGGIKCTSFLTGQEIAVWHLGAARVRNGIMTIQEARRSAEVSGVLYCLSCNP